MKRIFPLLVLLSSTAFVSARTHETIHSTFDDFSEGKLHQISLHTDGYLLSAPALETLAELDAPILWDAQTDSKGNLYVGTGNQGVIYKVSPDGEVETVFESNRLMARALVVDRRDRLYVSVSPDGTIYRISKNGVVEVFLKMPDEYVWDLVFGEDDELYVASGSHGIIYRIDTGAKTPEAEVFFDSEETHITALAFEADGNLLAGSATHGLLYRVDSEGEGDVIYSTGEREVRTILPQKDGSIYFSSFNQPSRSSNLKKTSSSSSSGNKSSNASGSSFFADTDTPSNGDSKATPFYAMTISGRANDSGSLYWMDTDGFVTNWWLENKTSIYSLAQLPNGHLILGTGSKGNLYEVDQPGDWTLLHTLESAGEITGIIPSGEGGIYYLICSNPGRILKLDTTEASVGFFESEVVDFDHVSRFGSFQLYSEPLGESIAGVEVRGGNLESPDRTWTDWVVLAGENGVFRNPLPPSRFMQYRILFDDDSVPAVHQIRFFSRTQNLAPLITSIKILDSGYEAKSFTASSTTPSVDLGRSLNSGIENEFAKLANKPKQVKLFPKPGSQTVAWKSIDGNGDDLSYTVKLSALGEDTWVTLADDLEVTYLSYTTQGFSDGYYRLKITVTDDPSNPASEAKTGEQISEVFLIDNTPPIILVNDYDRDGDQVTLKLTASDSTSLIRSASYRLNGNDLDSIHPDDGILDESLETFTLILDSPTDSIQSLLMEIEDEVGNVTALTRRLD
jgi:sugar lactone lactonase YvrE